MTIHIITVATHKEGKLQELIDNKFNTNIIVLGMCKKWTGFRMKNELALEYINKYIPWKYITFLVDAIKDEVFNSLDIIANKQGNSEDGETPKTEKK